MKHLERWNSRKKDLLLLQKNLRRQRKEKLDVEQELRKWRAEHEHRRRASNQAKGGANPQRITPKLLEQPSGLQVPVSFRWLIQSNAYQKTQFKYSCTNSEDKESNREVKK